MRGLDAARGLAVVGMFAAHAGNPGLWGEESSALLGFAQGRSSILFAVVAGISLAMMTGGPLPPQGEDLRTARLRIGTRAAALLLVSGVVSILPSAVAVILSSYALWFVLAIPFLLMRPRSLLVMAAMHAALGSLVGIGAS